VCVQSVKADRISFSVLKKTFYFSAEKDIRSFGIFIFFGLNSRIFQTSNLLPIRILKNNYMCVCTISKGRPNFVFGTEKNFLFFGRKRHTFFRYFFLVWTVVFSAVNGNEKWTKRFQPLGYQITNTRDVYQSNEIRRLTICRLFPNGTCLVLYAGHQYRTKTWTDSRQAMTH